MLVTTAAAASPAPATSWFRDGARSVEVARLGPPAIDALGRTLTPVELQYRGRSRRAPSAVPAFVDATAIVAIDEGTGAEEALDARGVRLIRPLMPSIGLWLAEDQTGGDGIDAAARLRGDDARAAGIRHAIPNLYVRMRAHGSPYTPNDPRFPGQWYFENLKMSDAWGITQGDPGTTIVVVDTGCDLTHPDLAGKLDPGLDVVDGDMDPSFDPNEAGSAHGTACAGIAAAMTDNNEGIAGGCPACRLRCVRLINDMPLPISADVDVFQFALDTGAAVVSNSWGFVDSIPVPKALEDAVNNVFDNGRGGKGALVVFAAGNDDRVIEDDELQAVRGVLCVGAINNFDDQTPFTNTGNAVDLVAPTGTLTTDIQGAGGDDPTDYTSHFGGTSSACPVVAGIAGLLVSAAPDLTSAQLYDAMIRTARPAPFAVPDVNGHDPVFGYGIIDPVGALGDVLGTGGGGGGGGSGGGETGGGEGCGCAVPGADPTALATCLYLAALGALRARRRARAK